MSRRTMLAPIRPRPIMPSCMPPSLPIGAPGTHGAHGRFADVDDRSRDLDDEIAGCAAAHQQLLAHIDPLDDAAIRLPSLLPGWTVGHVLTHVARNADSFVRILEGAERGEILDQYEGGVESRAADIEAGAGRSAGDLVHDV